MVVGEAHRIVGEESVVENPERLVTWIWERASTLRLKTAFGMVAFVSDET